jgi:hypothetical protein
LKLFLLLEGELNKLKELYESKKKKYEGFGQKYSKKFQQFYEENQFFPVLLVKSYVLLMP